MKKPGYRRALAFFAALIALAAAHPAEAATYNWTGSSGYEWATKNSWNLSTSSSSHAVPTGNNNDSATLHNADIRNSYFKSGKDRLITFSAARKMYWKTHVRSAGSADNPVVFRADGDAYGLQAGALSNENDSHYNQARGWFIANDTDNAWLRIEKGTYSTGPYGYWYIGNAGFTGNVTAESGVTMSATKSIDMVNGSLKLNGATMTSNGTVLIGGHGNGNKGAANTHAVIEMNGGTASSSSNTEIGNFYGSTTGGSALLSVSGGAKYTCKVNLHLGAGSGCIENDQSWLTVEGENSEVTVESAIYINGSKGGITIRNKGLLNVKGDSEHNVDIALADGSRSTAGGDFAITLGDDGTLATPGFKFRDRTLSPQQVKLAFEGGTLKANADNTAFIPKHDQLKVTVNAAGGIIDSNGKTIAIPANITKADGVATPGDITVKGGGNVKFSGTLACGVKAFSGTVLDIGSTATVESLLDNDALKITAVVSSDSNPVTDDVFANYTDAAASMPTAEQIATIPITFEDGTDASEEYALEASGTSVLWKNISAPTWTGAADGNFSNAANWKNGNKPVNGSPVYFAATSPVTARNDIEGLSVSQIIFAEGSAGATIAGNTIEVTGSVVNNSGAAQTISAPVVFTGDITTTMADAASTVNYAGGVTGAKIAASSADERVLRGDYTLTGEDVWPADANGYSQQTTPSNGEKWTLKSGSTLRIKKANLKNFTIESGATAIAETACHRQQSYYERVNPSSNYKYYNLLTEANHGTYKIGVLETAGNLEIYPAYSEENYSGGVTIVDKLNFGSSAKFGSMSTQAFYLSPGHRTASGWAGDGAGVWAIGAGGLVLKAPAMAQTIWYRMRGDVTLKSIADWTLYENPSNLPPYEVGGEDTSKCSTLNTWRTKAWVENQTVASLSIDNGATLIIDTSHFATDGETGVAGHTVTFEGQVAGDATAKVAVAGDGTLVWDARAAKFTGAISVANGSTLKLAGCAYGFKEIAGFELYGSLVIDPIRKPVSVNATPVFGSGAKIRLDAGFDGTTLGKFILMTWTESEDGEGGTVAATIPAGLLDASNLGAAGTLSVETAPDGASKQLVLRVGDYEADAKAIRILCIGDSITQGVSGRNDYDDESQYRTTIAALLAARGYKPQMLGHWKLHDKDSAGVLQPEEWTWHSGVSGDSIIASINGTTCTGGALDNLHLYLDVAGYPDVVTVLIGTNDMGQQGKTTEVVYPTWTKLLHTIARERPDAKIVAGTILDRAASTDVTGKTRAFNELAKAETGLPATVSLVDTAEAVPATLYVNFIGGDGTHPQWNGLYKLGKAFADGITAACPLATFAPTTDTTVTDGAQTATGAAGQTDLEAYIAAGDGVNPFVHAYTIDIAEKNGIARDGTPPYTWTAGISSTRRVTKVGYYMELVRKGTNRRRWVWVDMDAEGSTLDGVDFPWNATASRQAAASKLHIKSNDFGIHDVAPGDNTVYGIIEATPFNYSVNNGSLNVGGVSVKDVLNNTGWVDSLGTSGGFGCFQVHRVFTAAQKESAGFWHDAETLFAWNRWGSTSGSVGDDIGIGPFFNHATGTRSNTADYTGSADTGAAGSMYDKTGAGAYSVRRLEIWVVQKPNGARIMIR